MTVSVAPTFSQIKAKAAAILKKDPHARFIGIRAQGRWDGEEFCRDGDLVYRILQCDAPIQFRMAFQEEQKQASVTILVTPLAESRLSGDLLARLSRQRLHSLNRWGIVQLLFNAREIDPRVTRHGWIADLLLSLAPAEGYPPVPSAVLDAETVWDILLKLVIGMPDGAPDLATLIRWSSDPVHVARWKEAEQSFRHAASEWIARSSGPAGPAVLRCAFANPEPLALPVGLVLGIVYDEASKGKLERAAGRLEQLTGNDEIDPHVAERWHAACLDVVRRGFSLKKDALSWLDKADEILKSVGAESFAHVSDVSPLGFEQRLSRFGKAIAGAVSEMPIQGMDKIATARDLVFEHDLSKTDAGRRMERVSMAVRLARWLSLVDRKKIASPGSFAEAAKMYCENGGFVDWARQAIGGGEPVKALSNAYARIGEACAAIRESQNKAFAELLKNWTETGSESNAVLPVEKTVEEIVAPMSKSAPVLLLLIDGMSRAVFEELLEDITSSQWAELEKENGTPLPPVVSAIPSCTRLSRTSLFCGKLREGTAQDEIKGFANHPALNPGGDSKDAPVLFHKIDVADSNDASLSEEVRKKILSKSHKVVGVVINAVDDHLLKGDQTDSIWKAECIRALPALLYEAGNAGRVVAIMSDHGHVLENGTTAIPDGEGERWRLSSDSVNEGEIRITGSRVLADGADDVIALWTEKARYGPKKNGYHGGVSPQEMIIPMALLSAGDTNIYGWLQKPRRHPSWWHEPVSVEEDRAEKPVVVVEPPKKEPPKGQLSLFDEAPEPEKEEPSESPPESSPEESSSPEVAWTRKLVSCEAYKAQKSIVGRVPLKGEQVEALVLALTERGGKMTGAALALELEIPEFRLRGLIASAQRILNVDGYSILHLDEQSQTVELNVELMKRQFELED